MAWGRLVAGGAVLVLCVGLAVGCGPSHTRADYEAAAGSEAARTNRALHDRWAMTPLAQLRQEIPAAQWTEPRVREVCEADSATSFGERDPGTLTCVTDYVRQAGFDGDLADALRAVDAASRKLGWSDQDRTLETALAYYETTHPAEAATVPALKYLVPEPAAGATGCGGPSYLRASSMGRSSAPWATDFTERPVYDPVFERSSGPAAATTAPELLRGHRFVLTFGMGSQCRLPVG